MWTFARGIPTAPPETRHLRESWKIPSIDASPLPDTTKRKITHVDDNEGLERIVGAGQWSGSSWNVQVCLPHINRTLVAYLSDINRVFVAYIIMLFAATLSHINRTFAASVPHILFFSCIFASLPRVYYIIASFLSHG
jgi:hypothetical protein